MLREKAKFSSLFKPYRIIQVVDKLWYNGLFHEFEKKKSLGSAKSHFIKKYRI